MELKIQNVSMTYPSGKQALKGLNLDLKSPSLIGLLGPNGAGKSTLMKLLVAALMPTEGSILVDGAPLNKVEGKLKASLGYLPQDFGLFEELTVTQFLDYMAALKGLRSPQAAIRDVIRAVNLEEKARARIRTLSGGQRQRVGIARALAPSPRVIVCDEPVSALDVSIQAQILNLLRELQRSGDIAFLFISHDLAVVRYISQRVCVMFLGQLCEVCPTRDAYERPLHPYTQLLVNAAPEPDPVAARAEKQLLQGEIPSPINPPEGCRFCTRCPRATQLCRVRRPEMRDFGEGRFCACHHPLA